MKTTVWCLVVAISVSAVTVASKNNSTGRYKQSICLLIDYMRESTVSSLRQVCRGSSISIRFPCPPSNLVFHVVVSAKKKRRLDLFFRRIN